MLSILIHALLYFTTVVLIFS